MKILIDIGHPAHVHYFKNFILIMQNNGHQIYIIARDKEVTHRLLDAYKFAFVSRGKGGTRLISKIVYTFKADYLVYRLAIKWKPQLFLSFGSPYAAHISKILNIPHIALTDTEHAIMGLLAFVPFSAVILTPDCFYRNLGKNHIKIKGSFELCYLLLKYFKADRNIKKELGLTINEKYVLFRFVSWEASHDIGQSGITDKLKMSLINLFIQNGYKVFISSEGNLSQDFESYRIKISPEKMHDVLSAAEMFIGESGTMANEAALLGIPSVYINSLDAGVFQDEARFGLLYSFRSNDNVFDTVNHLLENPKLKLHHEERLSEMLKDKIDPTALLVWFVENYPMSFEKLKNEPDYQNRFKIGV